jgi:hypothetical protein
MLNFHMHPSETEPDRGYQVAGILRKSPEFCNLFPGIDIPAGCMAGEAELLPCVHTIRAYGHGPAQMGHLLSSGGKKLLVTADVSLLPALFAKNPGWQVSPDQDPPVAAETRRRIF